MFRIAIIGGSIEGPFAALPIHQHCISKHIQIDTHEQVYEYEAMGLGVGIGPNAATLVKKLGLLSEALKTAGDRAVASISSI
ncbi:hypothetical protein N7490_004507 [Penicillium lividum]|nr:hypothetical protein N7490_004507 [Penicillium lividum]